MAKPFYKLENFGAETSIGCLLRRLNNLMIPRAEARFADDDITFAHWVTLMCLRDGLASTCADISRHMNHDSGATTRLVDQLEKRGLVERTRSKTDRRVVHLSLTAEGKAVTKALAPRTMNFWNEMLDGFSGAEAAMLIELLSRLLARMENTPVETPATVSA
jgi:DNA-binding MarR family transcriptional regulator